MFRILTHAKYASNMAACYDSDVSDVTAPHVYDAWSIARRNPKLNLFQLVLHFLSLIFKSKR